MNDKLKISLEADKYYHIYNHANGNENIFCNDSNYLFFLKQYAKYINPIADTFAYCLMPNHFHFAVRIKNLKALALKNLQGFKNLEGLRDLEGGVFNLYVFLRKDSFCFLFDESIR